MNLKSSFNGFLTKDPAFGEAFYLNPERGVMHQLDSKVWVFHENAIEWENFTRVTKIPLSPVRNDFSLISDKAVSAMVILKHGESFVVPE